MDIAIPTDAAVTIPPGHNRVVITLNKGVDVDAFIAELSQAGNVSPAVPDRALEIANLKPESLYNVDFIMTAQEFEAIQQDPRVRAARWGSKRDNGIVLQPRAQAPEQPLYRTNTWNSNQDGNWGRAACANVVDPFPNTGSQSGHFISSFVRNYTLDGSGVDIVIMDSGIERTHPDWLNEQGVSRFQPVDWYAYPVATGVTVFGNLQQVTWGHAAEPAGAIPPGTYISIQGTITPADYVQSRVLVTASNATSTTVRYDSPRSGAITSALGVGLYWFPQGNVSYLANAYTDVSGHGTNVTSIAAGRRYGWATGANIYCMNILGENTGSTLPVDLAFNLIRIWHENKPRNNAGRARPTIINGSFGYSFTGIAGITGYNYRGGGNTALGYTSANAAAWQAVGVLGPSFNTTDGIPTNVDSVDSEIEDCIAAGVIVVAAAGNDSYKIDVPGGLDYDNYITSSAVLGGRNYYHRGGTPENIAGVISVGAIDYINNTTETKSEFSRTGPGIDIWSPGDFIAGACSNVLNLPGYPTSTDPSDTNYRTIKLSGTSQASPQVAGVLATIMQARPGLTPQTALTTLTGYATENRLANPGSNTYTSYQNLQGAANRYLRNPFVDNIVSNLQIAGGSITGSF